VVFLKCGKNDGITVYVPKETILKEVAAKIEQVKPAFLFWPSFPIAENLWASLECPLYEPAA
jgi:hypothetical protein